MDIANLIHLPRSAPNAYSMPTSNSLFNEHPPHFGPPMSGGSSSDGSECMAVDIPRLKLQDETKIPKQSISSMDIETASLLMMMLKSSPSEGAAPIAVDDQTFDIPYHTRVDSDDCSVVQHEHGYGFDDSSDPSAGSEVDDSDSDYNPSHATATRRRDRAGLSGRHGRRGGAAAKAMLINNDKQDVCSRKPAPSLKYGMDMAMTAKSVMISGRREYICPYAGCGRTFPSRAHVRRHEPVHSGVKRYACGHCGQRFTRNDNRMKHERIHQ